MGILSLKTQKRTPKSYRNQRSGLALVVGTLLALLNANRFIFVLHLARLRPVAKNSRSQLLFSVLRFLP